MFIKEFYETIGVDPTDVLNRFGSNETMLEKFLMKFLNDQTFLTLEEAIKKQDWEEVFRAAHTLKGICGNFDFKELYSLSSKIVEEYRANNFTPIPELFKTLKAEYERTVEALKSYLLVTA